MFLGLLSFIVQFKTHYLLHFNKVTSNRCPFTFQNNACFYGNLIPHSTVAHFQLFLQLLLKNKNNKLLVHSLLHSLWNYRLTATPGMSLVESVPAKHNSLICVGGLCVFYQAASLRQIQNQPKEIKTSAGCGIKVQINSKYLSENEKCPHNIHGHCLCVEKLLEREESHASQNIKQMNGERWRCQIPGVSQQ